MYTLTVYKYVDAKTILQILQKETQDNVLWRKKELQLTSEQSAFNIPARKPTTNQCIIETT